MFSVFIFGFTVFVFLGMKLGYGSYLTLRGKSVDKSIVALSAKISESEQANLTTFYSQLINLEKVIGGHTFASNIFYFLEENTLQDVYYANADFLLSEKRVSLNGVAQTMEDAIGQLTVIENAPEVKEMILNSIGFEGANVTIDFSVRFKDNFFDKII